jgi:hypothetical protein
MGQVVMAITAAQVSAGRKSLATQSAKSPNRIAKAVREIARAREPMGGAVSSGGRGPLRSALVRSLRRGVHTAMPPRLAEGGFARIDGHQSAEWRHQGNEQSAHIGALAKVGITSP